MAQRQFDVSLLFDLFVASQKLRRLMEGALAGAPLKPEEYAVYSLLFEAGPLTASEVARHTGMPLTTALDRLGAMTSRGHLARSRHPADGRAQQARLTDAGLRAFEETSRAWQPMVQSLEGALGKDVAGVREALRSLAAAAENSSRATSRST